MKWYKDIKQNKHFIGECVFCLYAGGSSNRNAGRDESVEDGVRPVEKHPHHVIIND